MRKLTHAALGAAIVVPLALAQGPALGAGVLVLGVIGGEAPDWIDFRSGFRRPVRIRHRGASHALPMLLLLTVALYVTVRFGAGVLASITGGWIDLGAEDVLLLSVAFGLGFFSHIASDACTYGGIQPLLPLAKVKIWLLPKALRSRSDGYLDVVAKLLAFSVLGFGLIVAVMRVSAIG